MKLPDYWSRRHKHLYNMPPTKSKRWKGSYDSSRCYSTEWEKRFVWVTKAPNSTKSAYCKLCRCVLKAKKDVLNTHAKTEKRQKCARTANSSQNIPYTCKRTENTPDSVKQVELELAACMACHSAVCSVDHISETVKRRGGNTTSGKIQPHRTKCTKLISNVITVVIKNDMKKNMAGKSLQCWQMKVQMCLRRNIWLLS